MKRLTIRNFDSLSTSVIIMAIQLLDWEAIEKHKHYKGSFNGIDVYYRKTKNGIAIDLHKE